jgi:hypothetical protein
MNAVNLVLRSFPERVRPRGGPDISKFLREVKMRIAVIALTSGFLFAATSALADDLMANTYANTVVTKDSKGMTSSLLFNQDGTYTIKATGPDGKPVQIPGKWTFKDDGKTICLAAAAPPSCSPLQAHSVGDSWTVTNDQNQTFNVSLTAGR